MWLARRHPSAEVTASLRVAWCKSENVQSGVIDFYDFINKVLPKDFNDVNDLFRVFYDKLTENWSKLNDAFRNMDRDRSGTVDPTEILGELKRMNINVTPELGREFVSHFDVDGDGEIDFAEFSRAIRNMDPDKKKKKKQSQIGQLWDPDQYAGQRIQEHRPRSAASLHSEAPVDEEREENQVGMQSARGLRNKDGVDLYAAKSNTGEEVGRITIDENGHFLQDGIPIDFIKILREKIERKRGGTTHPTHA